MNKDTSNDGDYYDNDGYLICGKCHTRKQCELTLFEGDMNRTRRVPIVCDCRKARLEATDAREQQRRFEQRMKALRRNGITDPAYLQYTFDQDDRKNAQVSSVCQKYVENWEEMKSNNIGILFYGDVGVGKSFLACCIANALLKKLVSVSVTNFPRILNILQRSFDDERQSFVDRLQQYSLLVIDDLGVERDTPYSAEQVYNVVDTRARTKKPLIITTNLSMKDLQNASTLSHKRIYDRVLEMCPIRLKLVGESRRISIANERKEKARKLLESDQGGLK